MLLMMLVLVLDRFERCLTPIDEQHDSSRYHDHVLRSLSSWSC